jgi:hypothetical protein
LCVSLSGSGEGWWQRFRMRCDGLVAEVADWAAGLEEVHARIAGAFARAEPRAEAAGEVSPDGMQRLLRTADWNADAVWDDPL